MNLIEELANAYLSITWSFEFGEKSIFLRFLQSANEYDDIILMNDGIVTSSISRNAKTRLL